MAGVRRAFAEAGPIYALLDAADRLTLATPDAAHTFPPAQRQEAYDWLERVLGGPAERESQR